MSGSRLSEIPLRVSYLQMSDSISLLKARYCLSVMRTASLCTLEEARHLVHCLSTEYLTPDTSRAVAIAERDALAAMMTLHERFLGRSVGAVAGEWSTAENALVRWVETSSEFSWALAPDAVTGLKPQG